MREGRATQADGRPKARAGIAPPAALSPRAMPQRTPIRWLPLLLLAACEALTSPLPAPPARVRPEVARFAPAHGVPGERVEVFGAGFRSGAKVRFGDRGETTPAEVDAGGGRLLVVVPEDAASGAISVIVEGVEARSAEPFTFDGLDRLRHARLGRSADLRVPVTKVVPVADYGGFALLAAKPWATAIFSGHGVPWIPVQDVVDVAASEDGGRLLLLDADRGGARPCAGIAGHLSLVPVPLSSGSARRICIGAPDQADLDPVALAVSGDGLHALVLAGSHAWLVDLSVQPAVSTLIVNEGVLDWTAAAWAGGTRFVMGEGADVRVVDWSENPPLLAEPVVLADVSASIETLATGGRRLAVGTFLGRVHLYDLEEWPPALVATVDTLVTDPVTSMAISDDGRRLVVSQAGEARLAMWDLRATLPVTLGAVELERPAHVATAPNGLFVAGMHGGVALVSQETGRLLERRRLKADLTPPVLRTYPRPDKPAERVVAIGSITFNRVVHLDPVTLDLLEQLEPVRGGDEVLSTIASNAASSALYLQRRNRLHRTDPTDGARELEDAWEIPSDTIVVSNGALSPDGRVLSLRAVKGAKGELRLLDTTRTWADLDPPALPANEATYASCDDTICAVVDDTSWALYDRAAALAGEVRRIGDAPAPLQGDDRLFFGRLSARGLLLADRAHLWRVDRTTGARQALGAWPSDALPPATWREAAVLSPGGRRLYWIDHSYEPPRLRAVAFDAGTWLPQGEPPALPLPNGAESLLPSPDGERLYVLDYADDRVWLVD